MRVGFVHGVLNTDNMSILGLTIDFGPYGWLEASTPTGRPTPPTPACAATASARSPPSSAGTRQLANALVPLFGGTEALQSVLERLRPGYARGFGDMTARRLGWGTYRPEEDVALINELHACCGAPRRTT